MKYNNYLVIRNDGIGDLILSLPLIYRIKKEKSENRVYLICSNRNIELAKYLKKTKLIHNICLLDLKKSKYLGYLNILKSLRSIIFKDIYILKPSISNLLLSLMLNREKIFSVISIDTSKLFGIKKHSPPLLTKLFLKDYELIDSRNNFDNSLNIHMSKHFLNLINLSNVNKSKFYRDIILDHNIFYHSELRYEKKIRNLIKHKKTKKIVLFHFDEKWNNSNTNTDVLLKKLELILTNKDIIFFLTKGIKANKYEDQFRKNIKLNIFKNNIITSKTYNNIYFFKKNTYLELVSLVKICDLIITPHGGLSHTSTLFGKKLIDLIKIERKNFYRKWKPLNKYIKQVNIDNINEVERNIITFLK